MAQKAEGSNPFAHPSFSIELVLQAGALGYATPPRILGVRYFLPLNKVPDFLIEGSSDMRIHFSVLDDISRL